MLSRLPPLPPYSRLAEFYFEYSRGFGPRYDDLLSALARRFGVAICDVLDVACGAGTLTARLAERFETVVGFDASEAMVRNARIACAAFENVVLSRGDFHTFRLERKFDAAVCGCDSLNYVERPEDLVLVFQQIANHLRPGGFFAFDVLDERRMKWWAAVDFEIELNETQFAMCSEYDDERRRETTHVVFADGVESHVRTSLETGDVTSASRAAGFDIVESLDDGVDFRRYYVLRMPAGSTR